MKCDDINQALQIQAVLISGQKMVIIERVCSKEVERSIQNDLWQWWHWQGLFVEVVITHFDLFEDWQSIIR
jgi:hypothetical protein